MSDSGSGSSEFYRETTKQAADAGSAARETYSRAAQSASETAGQAAQAARQVANSFPDIVKDWIEKQPFAAVGVALGIGWLYGRMHRPF